MVPKFFELLGHEKASVKKEVCWILSNITAGTSEQIGVVFATKERYHILAKMCKIEETEISREAIWAISNATSKAKPAQIKSLVDEGIIKLFVDLLDSSDHKTVAIVLEALKNVLKCGCDYFEENEENPFLEIFE